MYLNNKNIVTIEKMFINGSIHTIDKKNSVYEAIGINKGKIVFLGSNSEAMSLSDKNTKIIDLNHKTIVPGFIDTYIRIPEQLFMKKDDLNLFRCTNIDEYMATIREYIDTHSDKDIIYGCGWDNSRIIGARINYRERLNDLCYDKAIILRDRTGHILWLNDKAFERYRITKYTDSPIGGIIELDEKGELSGLLKDNAVNLVDAGELSNYSNKEYLAGFIKFQDRLHSYGITSVGIVENHCVQIPFDVYRLAEMKNILKLRINYGVKILPYEIKHKTIYEQLHKLKRQKIIYKSRYFDITRACFEGDGLIEMQSAFLFKPYRNGSNINTDFVGRFKWDMLEFKEAIKMANRLDFDTTVECSGDNACKAAMDGFEYSERNNNYNKWRNSIVNLDLITKYYIRRMKLLGISAIIHPFWYYQDRNMAESQYKSIGEDRIQRLYPYKTLVSNNIVTSSSSEFYVEDMPNPLKGIWCAATRNLYDLRKSEHYIENIMLIPEYRLNPDERVSILEAVRSFTIDAACVLGKEKETGSLEYGKNADFIVLDKNIFSCSPEQIANVNVCSTYFEGELVYTNE